MEQHCVSETRAGVYWDTDDLITFLGQKVKVQGLTITAEVHSTRRYRRVQLFLVTYIRGTEIDAFMMLCHCDVL